MSLKLASCVVCCCWCLYFCHLDLLVSRFLYISKSFESQCMYDCPILWSSSWRISFHISHHQKFQITVSREACGYFPDVVGQKVCLAVNVSPGVFSVRGEERRDVSEWQILKLQTLSLAGRLGQSVISRYNWHLSMSTGLTDSHRQPETNLSPDRSGVLKLKSS